MSKKIISFSLWGTNPKYVIGAIRNAELALNIYPGWICRFYIGQNTLKLIPDQISELKKIQNVEVIEMNEEGDWRGMFWRFYPCSDSDVEVMISRDTDSRLSLREKYAVDEWLNSSKDFHIMRDHHGHGTEILGGMWGVRNHLLSNMKSLIENFTIQNYWQIDQEFLTQIVFPIVKQNIFLHDPFFEGYPFPSARKDYEFVGDVFDEYERRDEKFKEDLKIFLRKNYLKLQLKRILKAYKRFILSFQVA